MLDLIASTPIARISVLVAIFAVVVLQQPVRWNYFASFGLLIGAVVMIFV